MDKSKRPFPIRKSNQSFRRRLPPIQPGDRIDYRNMSLLFQFISDRGKILSRRRNKVTLKQQRLITSAIKQARILSLLPFISTLVKKKKFPNRAPNKVKPYYIPTGVKKKKFPDRAPNKVKPYIPTGVKRKKFPDRAPNKVKSDTSTGVKRKKFPERARNKVKSNFT